MKRFLFSISCLLFVTIAAAQPGGNTDTIFRANANAFNPKNNPFNPYAGKTIRLINIKNVGFEGDIRDSGKVNGGFGVRIGNEENRHCGRDDEKRREIRVMPQGPIGFVRAVSRGGHAVGAQTDPSEKSRQRDVLRDVGIVNVTSGSQYGVLAAGP